MAQVQYIGQEDRVLIDIGSLTTGDTFFVSDDFASSLVRSLPDSYAIVEAPADDISTTTTSKKNSKTDTSAVAETPAAAASSADASPSTDA